MDDISYDDIVVFAKRECKAVGIECWNGELTITEKGALDVRELVEKASRFRVGDRYYSRDEFARLLAAATHKP
jgi:hypothetical protein